MERLRNRFEFVVCGDGEGRHNSDYYALQLAEIAGACQIVKGPGYWQGVSEDNTHVIIYTSDETLITSLIHQFRLIQQESSQEAMFVDCNGNGFILYNPADYNRILKVLHEEVLR